MADDVAVVQVQDLEEPEGVGDDARHGVILVGLRVVGVTLADLVHRYDAAFFG